MASALRRYHEFDAKNSRTWIELAYADLSLDKPGEVFSSLRRAIETGGEAARTVLRQDPRFAPLRPHPEFQKLLAPPQPAPNIPLPFMPKF